MERSLEIKAKYKVLSNICGNLTSVWLVAILATHEPLTILTNLLYAYISWFVAVKSEILGA